MKKILCLVLLMFSVCLITGCGKTEEVVEDPINIYLFRGKGCGFCKNFLNFVNDTLLQKYPGKFNLVTYEIWNNEDNNELKQKTVKFLNSTSTGDSVPFIVIGDKFFDGYINPWDSDIESAIENLYDSEERYDVFEEMKKADETLDLSKYTPNDLDGTLKEESITKNTFEEEKTPLSNVAVVLWNMAFTVIAVVVVVIVEYYNKKQILTELNSLKKESK